MPEWEIPVSICTKKVKDVEICTCNEVDLTRGKDTVTPLPAGTISATTGSIDAKRVTDALMGVDTLALPTRQCLFRASLELSSLTTTMK